MEDSDVFHGVVPPCIDVPLGLGYLSALFRTPKPGLRTTKKSGSLADPEWSELDTFIALHGLFAPSEC